MKFKFCIVAKNEQMLHEHLMVLYRPEFKLLRLGDLVSAE